MWFWTFYGNSKFTCVPDSISSPHRTIDSDTWKEIQRLIISIHLFLRRERNETQRLHLLAKTQNFSVARLQVGLFFTHKVKCNRYLTVVSERLNNYKQI